MDIWGLNLNNANNISNVGANKNVNSSLMSNPFDFAGGFNLPFGQGDFGLNLQNYFGYVDPSFMMNMVLFDKFLQNPSSVQYREKLFTENYNTKTDMAELKGYNPTYANALANIAEKNAKRTNGIGRCFRGVRESLEAAGLSKGEIRGQSAYQAADMLAEHNNFREVKGLSKEQLKALPAGCVMVWDKSRGHEHGHIAVTLGNGKEASDHVQKVCQRDADFRVFIPTGLSKDA